MSSEPILQSKILFEPIGFARNSMKLKYDAPIQPNGSADLTVIELLPGMNFEQALKDLDGFERIWLLWCFHRNDSWRPMVRPPRGPEKRRGVFATRSPHRPNSIGISAVPLLTISGLSITVGSCDLIDGTPILDIKPYIPSIDAFPDCSIGWLSAVEEWEKAAPDYNVILEPEADTQLEWLSEQGIDIFSRARLILERCPEPHRTRRITQIDKNLYRMGCGAWRLFFEVEGNKVRIKEVTPGYPAGALSDKTIETVPQREIQRLFLNRWPKLFKNT